MMTRRVKPDLRADVAVVGAGSAGAAAALRCARHGLRVVCVDRAPADRAGAVWVNGVLAGAFEAAGVAPPEGDELLARGHRLHLIAGWGPERVVTTAPALLEVDMRRLVARLHAACRAAGARLLTEVEVEAGAYDPAAGALPTSEGTLRAGWFVDASGLHGARLLGQPRVEPADLCVAAQQVRAVEDEGAARRFAADHGAEPGDALCFTGVSGGYSLLNVRLAPDARSVAILTGGVPGRGHASGVHVLRDFVRDRPWIGPARFGGSRALPIRRPYDRLADARTALLGDAACQVFAGHGSGVSEGLVAARMLADALAAGLGPPGYERRWMAARGGLFAAYALFARLAHTLDAEDRRRLLGAGMLDARSAAAAMEQRLPGPGGPGRLLALARRPAFSARLLPWFARMAAVSVLYRARPWDSRRLPRWSEAVARLFGDAPDVFAR